MLLEIKKHFLDNKQKMFLASNIPMRGIFFRGLVRTVKMFTFLVVV